MSAFAANFWLRSRTVGAFFAHERWSLCDYTEVMERYIEQALHRLRCAADAMEIAMDDVRRMAATRLCPQTIEQMPRFGSRPAAYFSALSFTLHWTETERTRCSKFWVS